MPQFPLAQRHGTPHSLRIATRRMLTGSPSLSSTSLSEVRKRMRGIGHHARASTGALSTPGSSAWWGAVPAVGFVATVGSLFPVANLLAFDAFGNRGPLLGTFRSVQMGAGAVVAASIGAGAQTVGLRPTLLVTLVAPLALALARHRSR